LKDFNTKIINHVFVAAKTLILGTDFLAIVFATKAQRQADSQLMNSWQPFLI
jgi:hypothetical protein